MRNLLVLLMLSMSVIVYAKDISVTIEDILMTVNGRAYSCKMIGTDRLDCPTGFVGVKGNATLGTSDFCVMKFEAKNDGSGRAVSRAAGTPYVNIDARASQLKCEAMREGGFSGTFTLISNPEWMTIARDLENVASNWLGGSVGSGHIPRGHSDYSPNRALAVTDVNNPYVGTGNNSRQSAGSGWEQKRTHTLSNGSEIWDIAGNVWEWTDWDAASAGFTSGPTGSLGRWRELSELSGSVVAPDLQSAGGYTSTQSFGKWIGGSGHAALRGGDWSDRANAGAFTLNLDYAPYTVRTFIGFRCVYRP